MVKVDNSLRIPQKTIYICTRKKGGKSYLHFL